MKWLRSILMGTLLCVHLTASGFSLLGPFEPWMQTTNGFRAPQDIGGPMNLGAGYRWNVPVVTYGFDPAFINCFGSNGVAAVERAISVLNALGPASQFMLTNFPSDTTRHNYLAQSEGLVDLKSTVLFLLLEQLGLAQPTRYDFCVHDFVVSNYNVTATVLRRNFDPVSLAPSTFVNGFQYGYQLILNTNPRYVDVDAVEFPVNPTDPSFSAVADAAGQGMPTVGSCYSGLTGDDVGGLAYLLSANRYVFEPLLPDVHGAGTNANNYVNVALRAGVDKITLVRQDYDSLLGLAFTPLTNQFIDHYVTNGVQAQQQLERVISRPDFIFSADDDTGFAMGTWGYRRTGAANWVNNSGLNNSAVASGPGIIRPQVTIAFRAFGVSDFVATDDSGTSLGEVLYLWGSFDGTTNAPIVFSGANASGQVNTLNLSLLLYGSAFAQGWPASIPIASPVSFGGSAALQSSTDLKTWVTLTTVTNRGITILWEHNCSQAKRFFRVLPQ